MSEKLSAEQQAQYAALAEEWEAVEGLPAGSVVTRGQGQTPGRAVLAEVMTPDELDAAIRRGRGRPRMAPGTGRSPKRQVRLPDELDAALVRRAAAEQVAVSEVMREALVRHLSTDVQRSA